MTAQTPWFERTFHFDFPVTLFPVIFSRLEGTTFRLQHLVLHADDLRCSVSQQGWSVKQHIGHLYDLEDLWWRRFQDFQEGKTELTTADLNNRKTHEANHNERSLSQLVSLFAAERQKMLKAIYPLGEGALSQTAIHPRLQQPMRLVDALYFVAEHDDHHLAFITASLRAPSPSIV